MGHAGEPEAGEWVWAEGGAPADSRRVGVVEGQCIHEGASVEEAHACRVEASDRGDLQEEKEKLGKETGDS